jgi:hypothetical protein
LSRTLEGVLAPTVLGSFWFLGGRFGNVSDNKKLFKIPFFMRK